MTSETASKSIRTISDSSTVRVSLMIVLIMAAVALVNRLGHIERQAGNIETALTGKIDSLKELILMKAQADKEAMTDKVTQLERRMSILEANVINVQNRMDK